MTTLTPGERAVRCLLGEPVDRIPFGVGLGWAPWGETLERWRKESGIPDLNPAQYLGFDPDFSAPSLISGIHPAFEHEVICEDENYITWRDGRGVTQRGRKDGGSIPEFLDYPVKTPDDWQRLKNERLIIDDPTRITQDWDAFRAHIQATGTAVQVGHYPWGVFGSPRDLMGVEEFLIAFHTEPEMIHDIMDHLTTLWLSLWEQVSEQVQIDHIHIWEDMSGKQGSLISPKMVEEFMMPCYDRIADFARRKGVRLVSVDTDGLCSELVPIMMNHGINVFLPFEVQAGNDILEYRRLYPTLGIYGGLDKRALAGSKQDIDREIEKAAQMLEKGRYVPAFDHLIPPDVPWERFVYAADKTRKLCGK